MADLQQMQALRQRMEKQLRRKANVVGVGVGFKESAGKITDEMALMVLVSDKVPLQMLARRDVVPQSIDGLTTDVMRVGKVVARPATTDRWRPAVGGISVGHYAITAGTLGAVVRDAKTDELLILSNNHVLANSNDAQIGDAIVQPGPLDGGRVPTDVIAHLHRFEPIRYKGAEEQNSKCPISVVIVGFLNALTKAIGSRSRFGTHPEELKNLVDAAIGRPVESDLLAEEIYKVGSVAGVADVSIGTAVKKCGRTTEFTTGRITVINTTLEVGYGGNRSAVFDNQILATDMSQPGDSGSLIVDNDNRAVGLLFAGSDEVTVLSPIRTVMDLLKIKFA
ncbi:hypothetical protein JW992_02960 [candidate division KSB1 bacterium]|nr:hypothetical protein [candidate division KSB1 bacterium]